ncbi:BRO1 domain-containing protein BROX [Nymphon striatum]|nr:BRO1 domain-containing protein BROX [Nymphon striatum]
MAHWFHRNPLKATSQVNFDLRMVASDGQALRICSELRQARAKLLELLPDANHGIETLEKTLNEYLSLLQGFIVATDERGGDSKLRFNTRFRWTNSLQGTSQQDAVFELVSYFVTMDEAKEVHKCLRKAAGLISCVQEKYVGQLLDKPQPGSDLDPRVLGAYINQCTAEAQEVTIARAMELKHNPSLISALANETSKIFVNAENSLSGLDPSECNKWKKYLYLKHMVYSAYVSFALAEKACKDYITAKGVGTMAKPEQHIFFQKLRPLIQRTLDKCTRENGFIYHHKVPYDVTPLEMKATYGLVKPEDFEMPAVSSLWTEATYKAFDLSKNVGVTDPANSKAAQKAEGELPPVKEITVPPGTKQPKNESGCVIS